LESGTEHKYQIAAQPKTIIKKREESKKKN